VLITFDGSTGYVRGMLPGGEEVFLRAEECLAATPADYSVGGAAHPPMGFATTSGRVPSTVSAVARQNVAMELQSRHHCVTKADSPAAAGVSAYFLQCVKKLLAFHRYVLLPPAGRQQYWNDLKKCQQFHALQRHQHLRARELAVIRQNTAAKHQQQRDAELAAAQKRRCDESVRIHDEERARKQALLMQHIERAEDTEWREAQWARAKAARGAGTDLGLSVASSSGGRNVVTPSGSVSGSSRGSSLPSVSASTISTLGAEADSFQSAASRSSSIRAGRSSPPSAPRPVHIVTPGSAPYDARNLAHTARSVHAQAHDTTSPYYEYHHAHLASTPTLSAVTALELRSHPASVPIHVVTPTEQGAGQRMVYAGADFTPLSSTYGRRYGQEVYMRDKIAGAKLFARGAMMDTQELLSKLKTSQ
jgi:hypothetical protein